MKRRIPRGTDAGLPKSCLATLQTVLDIRLQVARCSLGVRQQESASLADEVVELRKSEAAALDEAGAPLGRPIDALMHNHSLRHLVSLAQARGRREADSRAAEGKVSDAQAECVERDRKLAVVQQLQDRALKEHAALAARRQSREADLAWLARTQGQARR